jgi:hypothetical protein
MGVELLSLTEMRREGLKKKVLVSHNAMMERCVYHGVNMAVKKSPGAKLKVNLRKL